MIIKTWMLDSEYLCKSYRVYLAVSFQNTYWTINNLKVVFRQRIKGCVNVEKVWCVVTREVCVSLYFYFSIIKSHDLTSDPMYFTLSVITMFQFTCQCIFNEQNRTDENMYKCLNTRKIWRNSHQQWRCKH